MSRLESTLQKIDDGYLQALRYAIPNPRRYMAISVLLTIANVATGVKYGAPAKLAGLFFG